MTVLILALGVFAVGCHRDMITNRSASQLIGEPVTVSYVADPSVGHGKFRLENRGAVAFVGGVESAWAEFGGDRQSLNNVTVYDLDLERMVNPKSFKVDGGATMKFLVGFPTIAHEPRFGESIAIGVRLMVNGRKLQALSPVVFERRLPRNH